MKLSHMLVATLSLTTLLQAEPLKSSFSIETDPATFAFEGYALHLKKSFEALPQFQFGLGTYAMTFPDALVEIHEENKGFEQRLENGVGFFVDYFFEQEMQGLFTGFQLAHQNYKVTLANSSSEYGTILAMPYIGYQHHFNEHWYVKPWAGVGSSSKISGSSSVNGREFEVPAVIMFATLHAGYRF